MNVKQEMAEGRPLLSKMETGIGWGSIIKWFIESHEFANLHLEIDPPNILGPIHMALEPLLGREEP